MRQCDQQINDLRKKLVQIISSHQMNKKNKLLLWKDSKEQLSSYANSNEEQSYSGVNPKKEVSFGEIYFKSPPASRQNSVASFDEPSLDEPSLDESSLTEQENEYDEVSNENFYDASDDYEGDDEGSNV